MSVDAGSDLPSEMNVQQSEIERNQAEKRKIEAETEEIRSRIRWSRGGITLATVVKVVIGGLIAGVLIWGFCLNHLLAIHQSNELRLKDLQEKEKTLSAKNSGLEAANEGLRNKVIEFEKRIQKFENQLQASPENSSGPVYDAIKQTLQWLESEAYRLDETISVEPERDAASSGSSPKIAGKWVYIGNFRSGSWENSYFAIDKSFLPKSLEGTSAASLVEVNIRKQPYDGAIASVLRKGTVVRFGSIRIKGRGDEGYVWGRLTN